MDLGAEKEEEERGKLEEAEEMVTVEMLVVSTTEEQLLRSTLLLLLFLLRTMLRVLRIPPTLPAAPPLQSPSGGDNWELCWSQRQSALTRGVARQHWGVSAASSSFSSCQHVEAVNEGKHRDWELFRVREKSGREVEAKGRETQLWGRGGRKRRCRGRKRAGGGIKGGHNPPLWVNAEFKKSEKTQTWRIYHKDKVWGPLTHRHTSSYFFHPSAFLLFVSSQWRQTELHLNARPVETSLCSRRWTGEFRIIQRLNETAQLRHGWMPLG